MNTGRLAVLASRLELELIGPEDLPAAAIDELECGCDSPSLRILAGLMPTDLSTIRVMFDRALSELGVSRPSRREAVLHLAREHAKDVLSGTLAPYQGAKLIWELTLRAPAGSMPELDSFVYAASEWEDRREDREVLQDGIMSAVKVLLRSRVFASRKRPSR